MADNDSRSYRSRAPGASAAPSPRPPADDPLAELARLIGQGDAGDDYGQSHNGAAPQSGMDWAADRRARDPELPRPATQPQPEIHRPYPRGPALPARADFERARQAQPSPRYAPTRDDPHDYAAVDEPAYRDEPLLPASRDRQSLRARDVRYPPDRAAHEDAADEQDYALEDYEDEAATPRRRRGFVMVAAVLGLAVLGTAGAFAYRAMFGAPMLPSLPPIIKAEDGPNKIVPNADESHRATAKQTAGSGEKLVSREEKPVDVPAPVSTAPRVVSTIPVFPAPSPGAPGSPPPFSSGSSNLLAPAVPEAAAPAVPLPVLQAPPVSAAPAPPEQLAAPAPMPPASSMKKVHTVTIRSDGSSDTAAAPSQAPTSSTRPSASRTTAASRPASGPNAPLAIVPPQGDAAAQPAPATRTAVARPAPLASAPAAPAPLASAPPAPAVELAATGGGYAVQVSSQRSEAEAQSAYRALAAKYPSQLGSRAPIIRRADLGSKGVYYRALVGPFASMEQAASVCSSLKAAGGSCLVQKN